MFYSADDRSTRELAHADPEQMEKMAIEAGRQPALPAEGPAYRSPRSPGRQAVSECG
jgi:hypothetical protein